MSTNQERQKDETTLLESMYPDEFSWLSTFPDNTNGTAPDQHSDPKFSLKIHEKYTLEITLPSTYPSESKPTAYLQCAGDVPTSTRKTTRAALDEILSSQPAGEEILDTLIQALVERLSSLSSSTSEPESQTPATNHDLTSSDSKPDSKSNSKRPSGPEKIKLTLLWSHHLLATSKRKDIVSWSRELSLSGFSRPGYPGAILIEGRVEDVDEFVSRIKALRWQALQVRGEEIGHRRRIGASEGDGQGVVEVEGLGDVVDGLKKIGQEDLAKWFLEGMKIAHG